MQRSEGVPLMLDRLDAEAPSAAAPEGMVAQYKARGVCVFVCACVLGRGGGPPACPAAAIKVAEGLQGARIPPPASMPARKKEGAVRAVQGGRW